MFPVKLPMFVSDPNSVTIVLQKTRTAVIGWRKDTVANAVSSSTCSLRFWLRRSKDNRYITIVERLGGYHNYEKNHHD